MTQGFRGAVVACALVICACSTDPNVVKKKYLDSGNKYYDRGKYKEALIMYRNALRKDLKYGEAYYRAALTETKLGRVAEAARDLHRAVELQPDNLDAYNRLINIYLNSFLADRRKPKALVNEIKNLADKLAKSHSNTYEYQRVMGYLALTDNKVKDAIAYFEKANSMRPLQPDLVLVYIQSLSADGRAADAERIAYEMLKKDPKVLTVYDALFLEYVKQNRLADAERILKSKIDNNPKVSDNYLQLAAHYYSQRRKDDMLATLKRLSDNKADFPNAPLLVGDFFLRTRDMDAAVEQYKVGVDQVPAQKAVFQKRLIEVYVLQNKIKDAQVILEDILKTNPKDDEAIAIRASLLMLTGTRDQLQTAINDLQSVQSRMPENPVVRFNLGRAHLAKGDLQKAKIQFEEAIKLRSDYLLPRLALAQMQQQSGEYGKVIQMTSEVLNFDPANLQAKLLRTRALIGMGETKQARSELDRMLQASPSLSEARLQLAALDLVERRFDAAEEGFKRIRSENSDMRALMGLTEAYVLQGRFDPAMQLLDEEMRKNPDRVDLRVAHGNIAIRAQKYNVAIDDYKKALEKSPRSADVWLRLGETQRRSGDAAAAQASFSKAKELAPNNVVPYVQLALMHDAVGQKDQARPLYEQILKIQPDNPIALNNLAYMLADTGQDLDQALTMAQRAKQKLPQDSNVADTLGWVYIKKNLSDSAINIFDDLIRKEPKNPIFRYHMALALAQKGDKAAAKRELTAALNLSPTKPDEQKIRELMAKVNN
ncbi:MAG TPA: tetratricopeptide repeat protein [Bryobacteraceae bacterium]|jgi:tetratricopeptide (TPR) repeat protein|nr:tetratricopeptide repeat protein [Bryobacteraceae bacterium]